VSVSPGGVRIPTAVLREAQGADNPLAAAVRGLIARRQAAVLPGEPPYRPLIKFLVWPDGLRSFYLAYPAVEPLHVPMTRETLRGNREAKDEAAR
jgi:hypothetical protein